MSPTFRDCCGNCKPSICNEKALCEACLPGAIPGCNARDQQSFTSLQLPLAFYAYCAVLITVKTLHRRLLMVCKLSLILPDEALHGQISHTCQREPLHRPYAAPLENLASDSTFMYSYFFNEDYIRWERA